MTQTPSAGANLTVIVVAAGRGTRFGSDKPKQFLMLKDKPVVVHALDAFSAEFPAAKILLVLNPDDGVGYWKEASARYHGITPVIVNGGKSRTESVGNALAVIAKSGVAKGDIVMIHDGARPIVSRTMIRGLYDIVNDNDAVHGAVPCYLPTEALSIAEGERVTPVPRSGFRAVQTPQTFDAAMLIDCYHRLEASGNGEYDDDAAVFAKFSGEDIYCFPGDRNNIKITRPADIKIAEILMDTSL